MSRVFFEQGHAGRVGTIAFSADGSRVATASQESQDVRVWDASGQLVDVLDRGANAVTFAGNALVVARGHQEIARIQDGRETWSVEYERRAIAGLPSGEVIAVGMEDEVVRFGDDGKLRSKVALGDYADELVVRADGGLAAAWNASSLSLVRGSKATHLPWKGPDIATVAIHPTDDQVALFEGSFADLRLIVVDAKGKQLKKLNLSSLLGDQLDAPFGAIFLSPRRVAFFTSAERDQLRIIDLEDPKKSVACTIIQASAFAFSSDRSRAVFGTSEGAVSFFDLAGIADGKPPKLVRTTPGSDPLRAVGARAKPAAVYAVRGAAIEEWTAKGLIAKATGGSAAYVVESRPHGDEIMIGGEAASALLKQTTGKTSVKFKGTTRAVRAIAFHPKGDRVALGCCTFDMKGKIVKKNAVNGLVASLADGKRLLTADPSGPLRIVDWNGKELAQLEIPDRDEDGSVKSLAASPVGEAFACTAECAGDKGLLLWNGPERPPRALAGMSSRATFAFSPDGARIVAGDVEGLVRVYDVKSGKPTHEASFFHFGGKHVAFVAPSVVAVIARGSELRLWNLERDVWVALYATSATEWLALSSDGRFDGTKKMLSRVVQQGTPTAGLLTEWFR